MAYNKETDFYIPLPGIVEPSYFDYEEAPHVVTRQTAFFLNAYLIDSSNFRSIATQYLTDKTQNYLSQAQQGFHTVFDKARRMTREHLKETVDDGDFYLLNPNTESNEAFRHTLVIFSFMPEVMSTELLASGYSRQGIMNPPGTTMETLERIRELRNEVSKIISGETEPLTPVTSTDSLLRTYTFFETGQKLAVHMPQSQNEATDKLRSLLKNIKMDLD